MMLDFLTAVVWLMMIYPLPMVGWVSQG
jgi:hypothetical protein